MATDQHNASGNSPHASENDDSDNYSHKKSTDHNSPTTSSGDNETPKGASQNKDGGDDNLKPYASLQNHEDRNAIIQGVELESAKAEMGEVMEENQRLKQYLERITKDYQALQAKFYEIAQDCKKPKDARTGTPPREMGDEEDEAELVSLSLGRSSSLDDSKKSTTKLCSNGKSSNKEREVEVSGANKNNNLEEAKEIRSLALGLDCRFEASRTDPRQPLGTSSPDNSLDEMKDGEAGNKEACTQSTLPKNGNTRSSGDDELVQQPPVKKARVSVRARCDTPTMNDGCQWRKYGQKIAKGNPCPRAYYRCTVAPLCPVRKQVQRCAEDMSILITTYEGTHNHPLPISATAMASTTSAAAYMLMSGSSSSTQGPHQPTPTIAPTKEVELHNGLNFNIHDKSKLKPFCLPNASPFSPTPTHPTITLDLTTTTSSSTTQFNRSVTPNFTPRYSSTNLAFNTSCTSSNALPISWSNSLISYGTQPYNKPKVSPMEIGLSSFGRHQDTNTINLQSFLSKSNPTNLSNKQTLPDPIAQAAKVLTSDPSFQSVLTAALSSFISSNNSNGNLHGGDNKNNSSDFAQKIKWGDVQGSSTANSTLKSTSKGTNGCGSSLLHTSPSTTSTQPSGNMVFLSPQPPFSESKNTSTSPSDHIDHAN